MADVLVGKWKLDKNENFEKFMEVLGVGLATRKIGATVKNTNDISYDGKKFKIVQKSTFKNSEIEFELGQEFETTTVDGRKVRTVFTWENGKLIQKEWPIKNPESAEAIYEREINDAGDLITTCKCKDVVCVRTYKKA
ncbi:Myelin P2 protein [Holothuria leucospilota]|uniref:Myelin P2 protein n=1 Tax=Holothuria leucospilota TaxID=206669 RepID=A0A9Q1CEN6_HOLLE|nr:Myelin P2 protein [Holothuria leucospilota]